MKKILNFCQKSIVSGSVFTFSLAFSRRQVISSFRTNVSNMAIPSFRLVFFQSGIGGLSFPSPPVSVVGWVLSYSVSSASSWSMVGTENGSKSSTWSGLIGTQTRPETKSINRSIDRIVDMTLTNQSINQANEIGSTTYSTFLPDDDRKTDYKGGKASPTSLGMNGKRTLE